MCTKFGPNRLLRLTGELMTPKFAQIFACGKSLSTARPICINKGSKRVITRKDVPFEGLSDVFLNFGSFRLFDS